MNGSGIPVSGASPMTAAMLMTRDVITAYPDTPLSAAVRQMFQHRIDRLPVVRAKAAVEDRVRDARLEWAIVRPTLTFGSNDILINNLAWALRRLPVYGIPGRGRYPIQPVHVDDVARICLEAAEGRSGLVTDAAGPETPSYRDLVGTVRSAVGSRSLVVPMPAWAVLVAARAMGPIVHDVVLRRDEITELTTGFLTSREPPQGQIRPAEWIAQHGSELGRRWASELARNYSRTGQA